MNHRPVPFTTFPSTTTSTMALRASPDPDLPFPKPETSTITLPSKPTASLAYTYYAPSSISTPTHPNPFAQTFVIFLNGLGLARSSWTSAITHFLCKRASLHLPYPALVTYDRYGQGDSDRDPDDPEPPCHGHDAISAINALHELVLQLWDKKKHECVDASLLPTTSALPALIFVGNSLGCALARLFAQHHPGTVSGLLFLDSNMANSDFVSFLPDPDVPGFDPNSLPAGVSMDDVRKTREEHRKTFHPDNPTWEGLSRRNLRELLPLADGPKLVGYTKEALYHQHNEELAHLSPSLMQQDRIRSVSSMSSGAISSGVLSRGSSGQSGGITMSSSHRGSTGQLGSGNLATPSSHRGSSAQSGSGILPSSSSNIRLPSTLRDPPGPYLTVAGHDWLTFAQQCADGPLHTPQQLVMAYLNPTWTRYNEGLVNITDEDRAIGPIIALGCGHFIQKDGPQFVAEELASLLDRVVNRVEQVLEGDG